MSVDPINALVAAARERAQELKAMAAQADDRGTKIIEADAVRWSKLADDAAAHVVGSDLKNR